MSLSDEPGVRERRVVMGSVIRWERWLAAAGGAYMMFVPLFTLDSADNESIWVAEVMGLLIAAMALGALFVEAGSKAEGAQVLLGALLFSAPWVFGYSELSGTAGSAWVVGGVVVVASALSLYFETRQHIPRSSALRH
jgi:hypothetical protein